MDRQSAGTGLGREVEFRLQISHKRVDGGLIRPWHTGRRHLTAPKFTDHLLPHRGVFADALDIQRAQYKLCSTEFLVVAGDTVAIDDRAVL